MRRGLTLAVATAILALAGCGGGGSTVTGSVTKGGKPYTPAAGEQVSITLTQEGGSGTGSGVAGPDGTFKITAAEGAGLPAGKYKVGVTIYSAPSSDPKKPASPPKNLDAKEVWDVGGASSTFTIDLDKYK